MNIFTLRQMFQEFLEIRKHPEIMHKNYIYTLIVYYRSRRYNKLQSSINIWVHLIYIGMTMRFVDLLWRQHVESGAVAVSRLIDRFPAIRPTELDLNWGTGRDTKDLSASECRRGRPGSNWQEMSYSSFSVWIFSLAR